MRAIQALNILRLAGHVIDGKLLDLGCGQGWLTKKFNETGVFAVGVDRSIQLIRFAKRDSNGCEFVVSDGSYLPFKDSAFKTIVLNDVLEHIPYSDAISLMEESIRTMLNDGRIYISVMNRWQILEPHLMVPS
jgi:2-polyprenyl-3-methyl-5-hydroxy-6-metoxy-1,4-benzoquinol methylase